MEKWLFDEENDELYSLRATCYG